MRRCPRGEWRDLRGEEVRRVARPAGWLGWAWLGLAGYGGPVSVKCTPEREQGKADTHKLQREGWERRERDGEGERVLNEGQGWLCYSLNPKLATTSAFTILLPNLVEWAHIVFIIDRYESTHQDRKGDSNLSISSMGP